MQIKHPHFSRVKRGPDLSCVVVLSVFDFIFFRKKSEKIQLLDGTDVAVALDSFLVKLWNFEFKKVIKAKGETYSRIGLLRSYRNLQSYWTTTKPLKPARIAYMSRISHQACPLRTVTDLVISKFGLRV